MLLDLLFCSYDKIFKKTLFESFDSEQHNFRLFVIKMRSRFQVRPVAQLCDLYFVEDHWPQTVHLVASQSDTVLTAMVKIKLSGFSLPSIFNCTLANQFC